jgi:hypothetical protein
LDAHGEAVVRQKLLKRLLYPVLQKESLGFEVQGTFGVIQGTFGVI